MSELINNTEEELTQGIYRSYAVANNAAQQQLTPEESLSVLENQDKLPMSASFYNQNKEAYQQDNEDSLTNEFYRKLEENSRLYDISSDASTFAIAKNYYNNLEQIDNAFQKIVNYEKQSFLGRVTDDFNKANAQFEVNAFARQINDKRRNGEDVTADLEELERRNQAVANMAGSHKMSIAQSTASVLASAWQTKETLAASTAGAMVSPFLGGAIGIAGTIKQTKEMEYNATVAELMRDGDMDPEDIHLVADVYSNVSSFIEAAGFTAGAAPIMSTFAKGLKNLAMKGGKKTLLDIAKKVSTKEGAIQVVKYMLGGGSLNALSETAEEVLQEEAAEVIGGMSPEDLQSPDYLKIGRETYTKTWNDVSKLATKLMKDKKLLDEEQELWDLIRFTYAGSYISTAPTAAVGKAMSLQVQNQKVESAENKLNEGRANLNLTMDIKKAIIESDINKKNPKAFDVIFKKIADANGADGKVYVTADALREALEKVQNNEEVIKLFQESGVIDALNNAVDGKIELDYATAKNTILSEQAEEVYNQIIGDIAWDSKTMTPNESIESFSNSVVDKLSGVASEKVAELEEKLLNSMDKKGTKEKRLAHANAVMALHAANALHNANPERSLEDYLTEVVDNFVVGDAVINTVDNVIRDTVLKQEGWHGGAELEGGKFSLKYAGKQTGLAHGYGVYAAKQRNTADYYRSSIDYNFTVKGENIASIHRKLMEDNEYEKTSLLEDLMLGKDVEAMYEGQEVKQWYVNNIKPFLKSEGKLYKLELPEDFELINEQATFNEQPYDVQAALLATSEEIEGFGLLKKAIEENAYGGDLYIALGKDIFYEQKGYEGGSTEIQEAASMYLDKLGVKGITYDGGSEGQNFVIFNPDNAKILDKFYQAIETQANRTTAGYFDPATLEIRLTSASNPTTFAHELMHYFMFNMVTYYNSGTMTEEWRKQFEKAMDWAGAEKDANGMYSFDASDPKVKAAQEKLAEGFTSYLLKGQAPSQNTKGLFNTFKTWFKAVYAMLRMKKVRLNQDVTRFYDKIFSVDGDVEMLATQEKLGMMEKPDGVTDEQWASYKQAKEDAKDAANSEALKIIAKRTKIQSEQAYKDVFDKFYNEKMAELKEDPAYTARAEMLRVKVSEESVERVAGEGKLDKRFIATDKDIANPESEVIGEDIEVLASRFGFGDNILEFIDWVNTAESEKATAEEYAREMADAWIDENYPELREVSPEHALRNIAAMKVNIYEYMILNKIPFNQFNVIFNEMTRTVESVCATMSSKELANTDKLEQRLKSVLNKTISLQNSNSTKGLASLKYRAAMLNYMIDISKAARRSIIGFSKHFNKYKKFPTNANLRTIDGQAWNLILDVLNKHGITRRHTASPDIKARLAEFINRVLDMSYSDVKELEGSLDILVNVKGTDFATMQFGDFVQLNESLRDIEAIGKKIKELVTKNEKMLIEDAEQSISEYAKQNGITARSTDDKGIKKFRNWWMGGVSMMETQLKEIMPADLFRKYVLPFFNGMSYAAEWKNKTSKKILQIITPVLKYQSRLINVAGHQLTVLEGLVVLLNSGNRHNKNCISQTLLEKKGIEANIESIIQEIPDAMRTVGINVDVRDVVQAVWDVFGESAPAMKEAQIQLNGREVNLIEPEPITFADGKVLRGGYYPAKGSDYTGNPKSVKDTSEFIKKTFSFTLDRTGQVHGDLPLDLTMLTSWVGQMGKLLFVANPANNIEKLANSKAIKAVWGDERIKNIKEWLALSILPERIDPVIAKFASIGSILTLGGNIAKFFVQAFGFTAAISYTGLHIVSSLAKCMNPVMWRSSYLNAKSKSAYMRNRYSDPLNHLYNAKSVESMFNSAISQGFDKAAAVFMSAVTLGDNFASTVVWDAVYNKSITEGLSEEEAIMSADSAVRITQGDTSHGSRPKAIQGWKRLLSPFCSYFLAVHNVITSKLQKSTPEAIFSATVMFVMYGMFVPYCESIFSSYFNFYGYSDEDKKKRKIKGLSQFRKDSQIENILSSSFNILLPVGGVASYPTAVTLKFFDKEGYTNPTVVSHQPIIKLTKVLTAFVGKQKGKGKTDPIKEVEKLFGIDKMIRSGRSLENIVTNFFD